MHLNNNLFTTQIHTYLTLQAEERKYRLQSQSSLKRVSRSKNNPTELRKVANQQHGRDAGRTTMMLIVIIAIFLSTEIPFMVITILHVLSTSIVKLLDYELAGNICLIINAVICFCFPLNFAIYCGMSRDFRDTFTAMFRSLANKFNVLKRYRF